MPPIVALVGPTATGKSRLALELAVELDGEIVNADALQVYRGFDLGTAKPTREERARVRHHLIDVLAPEERFSAGRFARMARGALAEIGERGRLALVVGGSGFYLKALLEGLSPLPTGDERVRRELEERAGREGLESLRSELERVDPRGAARLAPGDRQRTLRALEVAVATGRPLSEWQDRPPAEPALEAVKLGLTLPRALLYDRIAARVGRMVESGWVEEVASLLERGVEPTAPAFQAIGYRQIARHLLGGDTLETALEETVRATRRYAKRQMTWFRGDAGIRWIHAQDPAEARREALDTLGRFRSR